MLKLSRLLFMMNGDYKYLNYYEHALYNHILASQDPDMAGCVTYYTSLLPVRSSNTALRTILFGAVLAQVWKIMPSMPNPYTLKMVILY